jgi:protein SCO1/2
MTPIARTRILTFGGLLAGFIALGLVAVLLVLPRGGGNGRSAVGGPFALTAQDGTTVTQHALDGHPTLVFFGYTHCPDVCPATLAEISAVFKALGPDDKAQAKALFITVDPERDTPVVMKDYLSSFDPRITGLTGTPEQIKSVETAYKAYAKAVPDKDGTYTMDHTAITYLMDKDGTFVGAFNLDRPAKDAAAELKQYF